MNATACHLWLLLVAALVAMLPSSSSAETRTPSDSKQKVAPTIIDRFSPEEVTETPDFQKHVIPLMSRMGCNGRSCHGSFQGRGGFILSLFGYDFKADHAAITSGDEPRVDLQSPDESLIIFKPTDEDMHEGGQIYEDGSWEHRVLKNWIEAGAKFDADHIAA